MRLQPNLGHSEGGRRRPRDPQSVERGGYDGAGALPRPPRTSSPLDASSRQPASGSSYRQARVSEPTTTFPEPSTSAHVNSDLDQRPRRWWPVLLPLIALALAASLLIPAGRHQWAISLIRQPTPYTVLSFNKSWAIPTTATAGQPIVFSFTINNGQRHAIKYRYVVTESTEQVSETLAQDTKRVAPGGNWVVTKTVRLSCATGLSCRVAVYLPGHPETIDFLVTMQPRRKSHV
jgi:hypothetical protein